jgi:hypothetical protein
MTSVVDKVLALIELSSSPEEEEARSAALSACRHIRKYGLKIVPGESEPEEKPQPVRSRPPRPAGPGFWGYGRAVHETDRAILFMSDDIPVNSQYGDRRAWVPKSQISDESEVFRVGDEGYLAVSDWFARTVGWD